MMQIIKAPHSLRDQPFIGDVLAHLPGDMLEPVVKQYATIYTGGGYSSGNRHAANRFLADLDDTRKAGTTRILLADRDYLRSKAERLAVAAGQRLAAGGYSSAVVLLANHGLSEPLADTTEGKAARLCCVDWWMRQLTKQSEREAEHFAIKSGFVRRGVSPYVSTALLKHIQQKQQASREAMENMEAVNVDTGETMPMMDILKGSTANPEVRRVELMVRCRGFEEYAKQHNHAAAFYTITAPSKYHATAWNSAARKAYDNRKFSGVSPRDTQRYLVGLWARIRAKLKRDSLNVYGFRVCEPHHDGTPHWHLLLFMQPHHQSAVTAIMQAYALAEDGNEHGAAKHRFTVEIIDASKGSATGYIAKYVSKNINGAGINEDFESGDDAATSAERVRVWASLWGIRQFQMVGGAPVGVWRELRRIDSAEHDVIEQARQAADKADWLQYLIIQGGADVDRKDQPLKCYTVERIDAATGQPIINRYGEPVDKVEGVSLLDMAKAVTRVHEWIIQRKPETREENNAYKLASTAFDLEGAAARSSVNNCTAKPYDLMNDLIERGAVSAGRVH